MVKLFMIADDFTGALDTGVQFAQQGIRTQVFTTQKLNAHEIKMDTEVVVVDTETRPLSPQKAYSIVKDLAVWAREQNIPIIFKKTDSALRGNIGAELQALADTVQDTVYFLPGHPKIDRVTKDGIQFISEQLLEDSVFGQDPFEPVTKSYIPDIIHEQSNIFVTCLGEKDELPYDTKTAKIAVCDTTCVAGLDNRLEALIQTDRLHWLAGCAGLAERLVQKLSFSRHKKNDFRKTKAFYVACGSLNRITQEQILYAIKNHHFVCRHLTFEQKLLPHYYDTAQGKQDLEEICSLLETQNKVIIDTFDAEEIQEKKAEFLAQYHITKNDIRVLIPQCHGRILQEILKKQQDITILMTGGDTLMGFMHLIGCNQLEPICELEQGTVLSFLEYDGRLQQVISKSGGFGTKDVLENIADKILNKN